MNTYNTGKYQHITNYLDSTQNIMQTQFFNRRLIYSPKKKKLFIKKNEYKIFEEQCRSNGFEVINFKDKPSVITSYKDYPSAHEVVNILTIKYTKTQYLNFIIISPKKNLVNTSIIYDVDPAFDELHFN